MQWMLLPYKRYFEFSGRSRRREYWMFFLFVMIVYFILMMLGAMSPATVDPQTGMVSGGGPTGVMGIVFMLFWLVTIIPSIMLAIRRMHDQDRSGWWVLVPIANFIFLFIEGTKGPNRFGPDPKDPSGTEVFA